MNFFLVETSFFFSFFFSFFLLYFFPFLDRGSMLSSDKFDGRGDDRVALDADRGLRINR